MTESESKALKDFLLDIHCLDALDNWKERVNIFDVLKVTNAEIRHSNILAWLLDPNENHGLGDSFIKGFITKVVQRCPAQMCDPFNILLQDFFTYQIYREANHMDLVLVSKEEKTAIIIENKIWSGESSHQLKAYERQSQTDYSDCEQLLYVFLTPDGYDSSDPEKWVSLSYEEIINALEMTARDKRLTPEVTLIVQNYIEILRKKIMKERDEALSKICNDIYNKHRTALRLIFENVKIDNSADSEIICGELRAMANEGEILYAGNNSWGFFTKEMNALLPQLNEANGSWGTKEVYWYWLEKFGDDLVIHFELGGWNITEEHRANMNALIRIAGKKQDDFRYKRLYYKKIKIQQDNYEDRLRKAVRNLVSSAIQNEKLWLAKICDQSKDQN
jgi:hypothetical protein